MKDAESHFYCSAGLCAQVHGAYLHVHDMLVLRSTLEALPDACDELSWMSSD